MSPDRPRILIVNPFGIGDVLFSTPLIRAVRQAFASAYLAYLGNRRTEPILCRNPHLNDVFIYEKDELVALWQRRPLAGAQALGGLLWQIRAARFDMAIDLSLGERYSFILGLLGVRRRIGFDFRRRGRFLTHRMKIDGFHGRHVVEYYADLLRMIGIRLDDRRFEVVPQDVDRTGAGPLLGRLRELGTRRLIGLVPAGGVSWGSEASFRRWSQDKFIHVAQTLIRRYGAVIAVLGEPKDQAVCAQIAGKLGPSAVDLSGQTNLGQFISVIAACHLVIANDGGPVHLAASQGVPTVAIFGPVDPVVYGPYPPLAHHQFVYKRDLPCRPCYHQFRLPPCPYERACLRELEEDDVLTACERLLGAAS